MIDLPLEIMDLIMTFVDAPTLYKLGRTSHRFHFLAKKYLNTNHIKYISIRLWMHQPGTMSHTPIDFDHQPTSLSSSLSRTIPTFCFNKQPIQFDPKKPIFMDGCTIIIHPNPLQTSRNNYGITYQQPTLMNIVTTSSSWNVKRPGQWSMQCELGQDGFLKPMELICNINLFNPDTLRSVLCQQTIRLQERIQQKKQRQNHRRSTLITGLPSPTKEPYSPKSCGILPSNSSTHHHQSNPFTSLFTSISS